MIDANIIRVNVIRRGDAFAKTGRPGLSELQLSEFWHRWRARESMPASGMHWAEIGPLADSLQ